MIFRRKTMEYKVRIHPIERSVYIPKIILETLGSEITIFPDKAAAIVYPSGQDPATVIKSVKILLKHLQFERSLTGTKDKTSVR
jgi:hypothetical protein